MPDSNLGINILFWLISSSVLLLVSTSTLFYASSFPHSPMMYLYEEAELTRDLERHWLQLIIQTSWATLILNKHINSKSIFPCLLLKSKFLYKNRICLHQQYSGENNNSMHIIYLNTVHCTLQHRSDYRRKTLYTAAMLSYQIKEEEDVGVAAHTHLRSMVSGRK